MSQNANGIQRISSLWIPSLGLNIQQDPWSCLPTKSFLKFTFFTFPNSQIQMGTKQKSPTFSWRAKMTMNFHFPIIFPNPRFLFIITFNSFMLVRATVLHLRPFQTRRFHALSFFLTLILQIRERLKNWERERARARGNDFWTNRWILFSTSLVRCTCGSCFRWRHYCCSCILSGLFCF